MIQTLLICALVITALIIAYAIWNKATRLTFKETVNSRQKFNNFDPQQYVLNLSKSQFDLLQKMTTDESKKRKLRVEWKYTTPSGKQSHTAHKNYSLYEIKEIVNKLAPVFQKGRRKIDALNMLYAQQLEQGKEVRDNIPKIYCYSIPGSDNHDGMIKVGYAKNNALKRIEQQFKTAAHLNIQYEVLFIMPALTITEEEFLDHTVHRVLKGLGVKNPVGEWFSCSTNVAVKAVKMVQNNEANV